MLRSFWLPNSRFHGFSPTAMTTHALREVFKSNKTAFGTWISLPGYFHARTVAQASTRLSWVMIDCEHGQVPLHPGVSESIAAIHSVGSGAPSALVRVPATGISSSTSWQIKYALDAGARGVLVPMVFRHFLSCLRLKYNEAMV